MSSRALSVLLLFPLLAGCQQGVPEKQIVVKASNDPLHEPRQILERYAQGQPLASEVSSFPAMVENVRKSDPERADILQKGLDELQKGGRAARVTKAKELLDKLKPSMTAAPAAATPPADAAPAEAPPAAEPAPVEPKP